MLLLSCWVYTHTQKRYARWQFLVTALPLLAQLSTHTQSAQHTVRPVVMPPRRSSGASRGGRGAATATQTDDASVEEVVVGSPNKRRRNAPQYGGPRTRSAPNGITGRDQCSLQSNAVRPVLLSLALRDRLISEVSAIRSMRFPILNRDFGDFRNNTSITQRCDQGCPDPQLAATAPSWTGSTGPPVLLF
eukprot:COSAG02_NODE_21684_length_778_cov_6.709867_1_plen_190_part_00